MTAHLLSALLWLVVVVLAVAVGVYLLGAMFDLIADIRLKWWRRKWAKVGATWRRTTKNSDDEEVYARTGDPVS